MDTLLEKGFHFKFFGGLMVFRGHNTPFRGCYGLLLQIFLWFDGGGVFWGSLESPREPQNTPSSNHKKI